MSIFTQQLNPMTGKMEWGIQPEDYDYKREVARSAYADMLHDRERNDKYFEGLRRATADLRLQGEEVHVLDIGTGTGLLSMMAVACGADSVTACEAFRPMAECAQQILKANGLNDKVRLIHKRSTDLEVGPGKDMERRANLLVTEVLDTELIGEGAIETYQHARDFLLTENALLVPSEATVYAQVVSSVFLQRWNRLKPIKTTSTVNGNKSKTLVDIPDSVRLCPGTAALHDLQLSQVPRSFFTIMSNPLPVFRFDWSGKKYRLPLKEMTRYQFKSLAMAEVDAVFMWWDIKMDQKGEIVLSCAPFWAHPNLEGGDIKLLAHDIPWRDHWMQAVYFLPKSSLFQKSTSLTLLSSHDQYSLWFDVVREERDVTRSERPACECGVHIACSRSRLGQLNDPRRLKLYTKVLQKYIDKDSVLLVFGDSCLMAIAAVKLGAFHVYIAEHNGSSKKLMQEFIEENKVHDKVTHLSTELSLVQPTQLVKPITLIFSEPYFSDALLPWHSIYTWYLKDSGHHLLSQDKAAMTITPNRVTIWAVPVQFRDLWKIRAPVKECNGFKMDIFDKLIESACDEVDENVEPQPLWEYPAKALGQPVRLLTLDLTDSVPENPITEESSSCLEGCGTLNGVALWADWHFTEREEDILTTGPVEKIVVNENVRWDVYSRQGIYLMKDYVQINQTSNHKLCYSSVFTPKAGTISFKFSVDKEM